MSNYAPCGCWVGPWWSVSPPPVCAAHGGGAYPPQQRTFASSGTLTPFSAGTLGNAEIERIAQRVAELLKPKRKKARR